MNNRSYAESVWHGLRSALFCILISASCAEILRAGESAVLPESGFVHQKGLLSPSFVRSTSEDRPALSSPSRRDAMARQGGGEREDSVPVISSPGSQTTGAAPDNNARQFSVRHWTADDGLPQNRVTCLKQTRNDMDCLWLSGLHGIHRVKRADLNAVADGHARTALFVTLGTADGMANPETNGGENQPAGWKARDGRLWFPTVTGVVVIDPKLVSLNEQPPPVVIEEVKADEAIIFGDGLQAVGESKVQSLKSKVGDRSLLTSAATMGRTRIGAGHGRVVEFRYTANSFVAPERVRFRCRLRGVDPDWREETKERVAYYINLRPGNYQFEVMAAKVEMSPPKIV